MNQKILIIGGCGYVGSFLYSYLKSKYSTVDTVDTEWFGNFVNPKNKKIDYKDLNKSFFSEYENIVLLAGYSSVKMCMNNMKASFENNVVNFINLLDKIEDQKFIYASSSSVYGNTGKKLIQEDYDKYTPSNFYDLSKKEIDYYAQLSGKKYYGLRLGTVNGYSPNLRTDLMINKMYLDARNTGIINVKNIKVHRPILGINDLSRAISTIIEKGKDSGIYNLASVNMEIGEIAKSVANTMRGIKIINKGNTDGYDFSVSTKKFQNTYNFKFADTTESIVDALISNFENIKTFKGRSMHEKS